MSKRVIGLHCGFASETAIVLVFCLVANAAPINRLTPDKFVSMARKAYREPAYANGGGGTLMVTNAIDSGAFDDRREGLIRWVNAPNARNIRDLGGWTGIQTGLVFRGTQICDQKGRLLGLTASGLKKLREDLGIRTDLDLRRPDEINGRTISPLGSNVNYVVASIEPYSNMFKTTNAYAKALRVFVDKKNFPVYFHCWGGADRTGMIALMLEALCGVDAADIEVDYELTSFALAPRLRTAPYFREIFEIIKKTEGCTLEEKISIFIQRHFGLSKAEIACIQRNLMGSSVDRSRCDRFRFSADAANR